MPAPTTSEAFLECVRKSGLVDPGYLDGHVESLRQGEGLPEEPALLARRLVDDGLLTAFHTGQLLRGKYKGFLVGKYKVLEPLGAGGMGHVFLCEHALMGHRVALKLLTGIPEDDLHAVERFFREARAGAMLNHPNLVRAHDIDHDGSYYYLVMDYVDGVSLQELIQRAGPLDPVRAAHYAAQAARGLAHLHQAGLVHRDLKPANLVLERTGRVRILDLGLARSLDEHRDGLTQKYDGQLILGTADYLAPEQALDGHHADVRSDVYALGATAYYLLAGRVPFPGKSAAQKIVAHQFKQADPLPQVRPGVPPALAAVVEKMMAKRPGDRYQGAAEVAEALAPWADSPLGPPPATDFPAPRQSACRKGSASSVVSKGTPPAGLSPAGLSSARLRGPSTPLSASKLARAPLQLTPKGEQPAASVRLATPGKAAPARWLQWARARPRWAWLAGAGVGLVLLVLLLLLR
jgi:eukaryotic-like serine/threonine-protein kinase